MKCLYNLNSALYCIKITELVINCTKKLLVTITSSLLLAFIHKCVKHYSYLLVHLHAMQMDTNMFTNKKVTITAKLITAWVE